jgi:diguanylate cyclase (GGDEF)-like protein/PAS domain S-box-containing protein
MEIQITLSGILKSYRRTDLLRLGAVTVVYLVLAKVGLFFALADPVITIFWPAGGFAVGVLLVLGLKQLPAILAGAVGAGFMAVEVPWVATMLGVADTVESLAAFWLLRRWFRFNTALDNRRDFFILALVVSAMASLASTVLGPPSLYLGDVIPLNALPSVALRWWAGDVLGIALVTPLVLVWSRCPGCLLRSARAGEAAAIIAASFLVGQAVFLGWFADVLRTHLSIAVVAPVVIWAGLRGGRHLTAFVQLTLFAQALWGANAGLGYFANGMAEDGLFNTWVFGMVLAVFGMALAVLAEESWKAQREQRRLSQTVAAGLNEIYLFDAQTLRFSFANRGALVNLGYGMEVMRSMRLYDVLVDLTPERFAVFAEQLRREETPMLMFESVFRRRNGSRYPVEVRLQLFEGEESPYFLAVVTDVTERVASERQLRLAALVFENTKDAVLISDADNRIQSINQACLDITGYAEHELLDRDPRILSSGMHTPSFFAAFWKALSLTGRWEGEIWNRRRNGAVYPAWMNVSAIKDSHGEVLNHVAIFSDITDRKAEMASLQHQAQHDFLTDLPNRVLFHDRFSQMLAGARRNGEVFALLYLDLDRFKPVNDSFGHRIGDLLLQQVARRLQDAVRETDTVCRQGGDEFSVLMSKVDSRSDVQVIIDKLIAAIHSPIHIESHRLNITISVGVAMYPEDGQDEASLMSHADAAMYRAKRERMATGILQPGAALPGNSLGLH